MSFKILLWSFVFITLTQNLQEEFYPEAKVNKILTKAFPAEKIVLNLISPIGLSQNNKEKLIIYQILSAGSNPIGYAVFTQARGRFEWFDYLLVCSPELKIKKVEILKYRSEHGGEITSKKWLHQFENYSEGALQYGKEISAISGATFSARSITEDVVRVMNILHKSANR